jgi:hypothetical protein
MSASMSAYLATVMSVLGRRLEAQGLRVYVERPVNRTEFPTLPVCDPTRQGACHAMSNHEVDFSCIISVQGSSMYLDHLLENFKLSVFAQCPTNFYSVGGYLHVIHIWFALLYVVRRESGGHMGIHIEGLRQC